MKAAPDGYSLVANTSTTMTFDPHATQLTYGVDDFTYIAAIGEFPEAYIALPDKGWKTLADALAAGKGEGLNYASTTSIDRVVSALIAKKSGTQLAAVPTRGGAEAVTQVMGGHVDLAYSSGAYFPQAMAGQVKVLAVLSDKRLKGLPDAPTLLELGYDIASVNLILFMAPKGLPADVRDKVLQRVCRCRQGREGRRPHGQAQPRRRRPRRRQADRDHARPQHPLQADDRPEQGAVSDAERAAAGSRRAALREAAIVVGLGIAAIALIPSQTTSGPVLGLPPAFLPTICAAAIVGAGLARLGCAAVEAGAAPAGEDRVARRARLGVAVAGVLALRLGPIAGLSRGAGLAAMRERRVCRAALAATLTLVVYQVWR